MKSKKPGLWRPAVGALAGVLCFVFLPANVIAQVVAAPQRTAAEMTQRLLHVVRASPEVLQAYTELKMRNADVRSAELQQYPKLELQTALGKSNSQLPNSLAVADARLTAGVRYTVFDAGRLNSRLTSARSGIQMGEHRTRRAVETVVFDAMSAYLQILRFELLLGVARNSEQALRDIEILEARKLALGGAGITDSRVAATRLALSANKLFQFQSSLEDAKTTFSALFGFMPLENELPVARVSTVWLQMGSDNLATYALENNAEIAEAASLISMSQAAVGAERAARYPNVDLTLTKLYEFPGPLSASPRLGVQFSLSTGTALESGSRIDKATAQVAADEAKLQIIKRDVMQRALASWRRTISGYQREKILSEAAAISGEVFKGRKKLNAAGRETTMVLLDSQVEENNVRIEWVTAIFDARLSELRLAKELGKLWPPKDADQTWAESFYKTEDYRTPVEQQLLTAVRGQGTNANGNPVKPSAPQPTSLGAIGQQYTSRIDRTKMAAALAEAGNSALEQDVSRPRIRVSTSVYQPPLVLVAPPSN